MGRGEIARPEAPCRPIFSAIPQNHVYSADYISKSDVLAPLSDAAFKVPMSYHGIYEIQTVLRISLDSEKARRLRFGQADPMPELAGTGS